MTETQTAAIAADEGAANSARPGDEMLPFLNNFHDIFMPCQIRNQNCTIMTSTFSLDCC